MVCALSECLCLSGKGSAFRHGEWLQELEALCCEHWVLEARCCEQWGLESRCCKHWGMEAPCCELQGLEAR